MALVSDSPIRWQPDPDFRGTFGIVSTCLSTLLLCLWSAVHVDIPIHPDRLHGLWVRIGWIFIGLVTPETLLFISYRQWTIARELLNDANTCNAFPAPKKPWYHFLGRQKASEYQKNCNHFKHRWTMVHSYYAAMGGFVFDTEQGDLAKRFLPEPYNNGHAGITPEGIQFLLKHQPELLPDLSSEEILDRSKRDGISKSILVVQVTFFLINCIARKSQGLPITLLEITTVAHALCSLLAYGFWWYKPLSVTYPTLIRGKEARETCALMCMASTCRYYFLGGYLMIWRPAELDSMDYHGDRTSNSEKPSILRTETTSSIAKAEPQLIDERNDFSPRNPIPKDGMSPWLDQTIGVWFLGSQPWYRREQLGLTDAESLKGIEHNKERWVLASNAARTLMEHITKLRRPIDSQLTDGYHAEEYYAEALVSPTSGLSPCLKYRGGDPRKFTLNENDPGPPAAIILAGLFGFPSLAAWNYVFPTALNQLLWRVAALAATFRGTIYWASREVGLRLTTHTSSRIARKMAAVIPVCLLMALLIPSSTILVFESFGQLLYLPPAAYKVPTFSRYWPHL